MEIIVNEVISNVRAVDDEIALSPDTMREIVRTVLEAVRRERSHERQLLEELGVDVEPAYARQGNGS